MEPGIGQPLARHQPLHHAGGELAFRHPFVVEALEGGRVLAQFLLGGHALADIAHDADEQPVVLEAHFRDGQLDGKRRTILAQPVDMAMRHADHPGHAAAHVGAHVAVVGAPMRFRHEHGHVLADQLLGQVAEHDLHHRVGGEDDATLVDGHHAVADIVGHRLVITLGLLQPALQGEGTHQGAQLGLEDGEIDRLGQVVVAPGRQAVHQVLFLVERGNENDRHPAATTRCLDAAGGLVTVHDRHHHVHQHQIRRFLLEHGDAGLAVLGEEHFTAKTLQEHLEQLPVGGHVVDHQHAQARDRIGGRTLGLPACCLLVPLPGFRQGVSLDRQIGRL